MKTNRSFLFVCTIALFLAFPFSLSAQKKGKEPEVKGYQFTDLVKIPTTPVKNQQSSGTCWSFATTSFIETELMRMEKGEYDLSEMYFVGQAYLSKADLYVRYQGNANFGPGGQAHDVMNVIRTAGMVPESVYNGKNYGSEMHNHSELQGVLSAMVNAVEKAGRPTTAWKRAFFATVQEYLGEFPETFSYSGSTYTPVSFLQMTGFNPNDFIEITSYTHHPFYERIMLEVPDNWSHDLYYNVPVDELMQVIDKALQNGYSVDWDGDVSEPEFSHKNRVAIVPVKLWESRTEAEKTSAFQEPGPEKTITQADRQVTFDNFTSADDHLMHIVGMAKDQNGTKYYLTKNSWGTERNSFGGYLYMSEAYVRLKTIAIMVHKDMIPTDIMEKFTK
jgi:bleomycin hydrolase